MDRTSTARCVRIVFLASLLDCIPLAVFAGFPATEVFLPAVGRVQGAGDPPSQFYTTVWATNLTNAPETFTFTFLKQGQANDVSPLSFQDALAPGETKVYENVLEGKLGLASGLGAARIVASGEIFVSERIYNQLPGDDIGNTQGLFFAGVPTSFSISLGQSATIQGVNQGGAENFRYNFALIETGGGSPTVRVALIDGGGATLGSRDYLLLPYEQLQPNVADILPGVATTNARLTATVTAGSGSVLLAGAQVANQSQDPSGFEMGFRGDLLAGAGSAGVTSLNGLTGAVSLIAGAEIQITPNGNSLLIEFTGADGNGLTAVTHDATLSGNGTAGAPLGVAAPLNLTAATGSPLTGVISGTNTGTGVGLYGNSTVAAGVYGTGNHYGVVGETNLGIAVYGKSIGNFGVGGQSEQSHGVIGMSSASGFAGVYGSGFRGVLGTSGDLFGVGGLLTEERPEGAGVYGADSTGPPVPSNAGLPPVGVRGESQSHFGVAGISATSVGVYGKSTNGLGVGGISDTSVGVRGDSTSSLGVFGVSGSGIGVRGHSNSAEAISGISETSFGVRGQTSSTANGIAGVLGTDGGAGVVTGFLSAGVRGESGTHTGVLGLSSEQAVVGRNSQNLVQGELASHRNDTYYGVYSDNPAHFGSLSVTGTKNFIEPHPTDRNKEIRFVSLEGPESGTYFRGHARIQGGFATIGVPEAFRLVTAEDGLTVVATPVGAPASIWVMHQGLDRIVLQSSADVEFNYIVNGVRKAFKDFAPIRGKSTFIPSGRNDERFPTYPAEIQRRLVDLEIYNPDGTVNLDTAHREGWDKAWEESLTTEED